jgi:hypothetical protein
MIVFTHVHSHRRQLPRLTPKISYDTVGMELYDPERTINDFLMSLEQCFAFCLFLYCINNDQANETIMVMKWSPLLRGSYQLMDLASYECLFSKLTQSIQGFKQLL